MPIVHMTSNNDETFPEGAICPLEYAHQRHKFVVVTYETHVGLCVAEQERNMRDDSDFYMIVWDAERGATDKIMYASTRGWTYPCMRSHRDATPEVAAAYRAWLDGIDAERIARNREAERLRPCKGKRVKIVKGHENKGVIGTITWEGTNKFSKSSSGLGAIRFGIDATNGRIFANGDQVEVVSE